MSNSNSPRPIQIVATHPDSERNFQALATTPQNIRTTRTAMHTACTNCFKNDVDEPGLSLRKCARVLLFHPILTELRAISPVQNCWYCSKECQKMYWPAAQKIVQHNRRFRHPAGSSKTCTLTNSSNTHIQACFHPPFRPPTPPAARQALMARIDIDIEPAEMPNFLGDQLDAKMKMKGMLQLNALTPLPPARESANRNGFSDDSVGLMEFGNGDGQQTITCPVHIQKAAMDLVRASPPWVMTSAITGKTTEVPFNIETCMEFINTHIRSDKKDPIALAHRDACVRHPNYFGTPVRNEIRTPLLY
ncbi:hypothetical protein B0H14DRAFT_3616050 [Mycena olivaceomarginata]|nr:hypothetical protein B0H14DRAFT_3616050 [Mycena olivaceomarginata]